MKIDVAYFFNLESNLLELKVTIGIGFEDITVVVADCFGKFSLSLLTDFLRSKLDFKSLRAEMGTFGVLTGNIGEFVLERDPKNLDGFSGLALGVDSNLALPLATAPTKLRKRNFTLFARQLIRLSIICEVS